MPRPYGAVCPVLANVGATFRSPAWVEARRPRSVLSGQGGAGGRPPPPPLRLAARTPPPPPPPLVGAGRARGGAPGRPPAWVEARRPRSVLSGQGRTAVRPYVSR